MSPSKIFASSNLDTPTHAELEGRRVFISGIGNASGERLAWAFAQQRTRLVLHSPQPMLQAAAVADTAKVCATAVRLFSGDLGSERGATERLARAALGAFGGFDLVVNLIGGSTKAVVSTVSNEDLEQAVADELRPAQVLARAVADHARNSGQPAAIMHVCLTKSGKLAEFAYYAMLKAGLESMVQDQARRWFSHDICVYAFLPAIADESFDDGWEADNVVSARSNFDSALASIVLNAACGRSQWLNGVTVAVPG